MRVRGFALLGLALLGLAAGPARAEGPAPLRLCADPDNLPFSSQAGDPPGLYVELAQGLAQKLGRPFTVVWQPTYFVRRMLRETLLAHKCDLFVGLPGSFEALGPRVTMSAPVLDVGYALVVPGSADPAAAGLLKGRKVAVQFGTPPQNYLATRDDVTAVTVMSPEEGMRALAEGKADAALIWGPSAGYLNTTQYQAAYRVLPVAGDGMQWRAAIGFAKGDAELKAQVEAALAGDPDLAQKLAAKYLLPDAAPITLAAADAPAAAPVQTAEAPLAGGISTTLRIPRVNRGTPTAPPVTAPAPESVPAGEPAPQDAGAAPLGAEAVSAGRMIFNSTCAHCHGPDAVQAVRNIDLRQLAHRYGAAMDSTFMTTVIQGRPDKGMPSWDGAFSETDLKQILAYLQTVQVR